VTLEVLIAIVLFIVAALLAYFFLSGFIWGAGFQPTPKKDIELAAELLGLKQGMIVFDLGSGTGDVLIHLARKYKVKCVGIEIDPLKVMLSKLRISRAKDLRTLIEIKRGNFLLVDLSKADAIYIFLFAGTKIMKSLEPKLLRELKEGAKIASYVHSFESWIPEASVGDVRVYSISDARQNYSNSASRDP
jgi:ribosomal protein L11 methylase PrmA